LIVSLAIKAEMSINQVKAVEKTISENSADRLKTTPLKKNTLYLLYYFVKVINFFNKVINHTFLKETVLAKLLNLRADRLKAIPLKAPCIYYIIL